MHKLSHLVSLVSLLPVFPDPSKMLAGPVALLCLAVALPRMAGGDLTGRMLARYGGEGANQAQAVTQTQDWDAMDVIRVIFLRYTFLLWGYFCPSTLFLTETSQEITVIDQIS